MSENYLRKTHQNNDLSIKDWLDQATRQLIFSDIASARLDAELILAHTIRKPRTWLHGHNDESLEERVIEIANARLDLRADSVPVAYIIGHKEFYGRPFKVTTATLIPRPESESLIDLLEIALSRINLDTLKHPLKLVDVGTGCGCLGITAKLKNSELDVTLIDNSRFALKVAEENATSLNASVKTLNSNLLAAYIYTADIIIANLPYVDPEWERSKETNHEPPSALFADNHGLALIFKLLAQSKQKLSGGGKLIIEADPVQHSAIIKQALKYGLILDMKQGYGLMFDKVA